jgi:hypothetical protein
MIYYHDLIECSRLQQRLETFDSTRTVAMEADSEYNLFSGPRTLQETLRDEYVEVQPQSNWAAQVNRSLTYPTEEVRWGYVFSNRHLEKYGSIFQFQPQRSPVQSSIWT